MSQTKNPQKKITKLGIWTAAAIIVLLLALLVIVPRVEAPDAAAQAEEALDAVAAAQAVSRELEGTYGSYWLGGGDPSLAAVHPINTAGVSDLRSISCEDGWVTAARIASDIYLRSNLDEATTQAGRGDVRRPGCVTREALSSMLSDLGMSEQLSTPRASAARPSEASLYRPSYHITPERNWMNDPQRPFFLDGLWHYYYLYNSDYPNGNGTEWYHLTSEDLQSWKDEGVAIEKYKNGLGDIETGSAVVDHQNTAGFGHGAVISVLTQQDQGVQRQSLFYSTDGGYTFTSFEGNPVMDNPGAEHWRDPKIIRDEENNQWVMVLAESHKLGLYTSPDLKQWQYVSGFERAGLGILECPDLFQMDLDGDPAKRTWILAASANGTDEGRTTGVAYWTGTWDGTHFTPQDERHQWLDAGSDFYAAVTWDDPRLTESQRMQSRQAMGWMNNWDYARKLPTQDWHGGMDTVIRDLRLKTVQDRPSLVSTPTKTLTSLEGPTSSSGHQRITSDGVTDLPIPEGGAYRLDMTIERSVDDDGSAAHLQLASNGSIFATIGYNFRDQTAYLTREQPPNTELGPLFTEPRTAAAPHKNGVVNLTLLVDHSSIEAFVNDGEQTLTSLVFPRAQQHTLKLLTETGTLSLKHLTYTPLSSTR